MFFPLRDENPTERAPFVNYGLIALNIAAFLYTWPSIAGGQWWILPGYGLVPRRTEEVYKECREQAVARAVGEIDAPVLAQARVQAAAR